MRLRNKIAALVVSAAALAGGVVMASPANAAIVGCSINQGVEIWEYASYGGKCVMLTGSYDDTHGIRYSDGVEVYYTAGSAENNYPWAITVCYNAHGGGPCRGYVAGPSSGNLGFQGVGTVYA
ncbi:hypothetical protein [Kitasatospora sp. NPDC004531]